MTQALVWLARTVLIGCAGTLASDRIVEGFSIKHGYSVALWLGVILSLLVLVMTSNPVRARLARGPLLIGGDFVELRRDAIGGPNLRVLGVEIYGRRVLESLSP
jgi:hypothetical protein